MRFKEDKENAVSNDSVVADRTCCSEVNNDLDANLEISVEVPEENGQKEGTFSSDESRPLKKAKSLSSENFHPDQIDNGGLYFISFFCLFFSGDVYVQLVLYLIVSSSFRHLYSHVCNRGMYD